MLPILDVLLEGPNYMLVSIELVEKASTMVAVMLMQSAVVGVDEVGRGRKDNANDEVVLDDDEAV